MQMCEAHLRYCDVGNKFHAYMKIMVFYMFKQLELFTTILYNYTHVISIINTLYLHFIFNKNKTM